MALDIARGTTRMLSEMGFAVLAELTLANRRRADLVALSPKSDIWIVEIKSSLADFAADSKWPEYQDYCDRFAFAVGPNFPVDVLPQTCGLIIADRFSAEIVRPSDEVKLAAARRKQVTLAYARSAAARLTRLADPDANLEQVWRSE